MVAVHAEKETIPINPDVKMFSRSKSHDFHESYFEHGCTVLTERDVLQTDIQGDSPGSRLKRWWYDLFLLSYADPRSREYYTSSYTMRKERQRHYRKHSGRIHPLSKFRKYWDFMMIIVLLANKVTFHHNTSVIFADLFKSFYYIGAFLELIIISDVFVNFATGYVDAHSRKIVLDKRLGILHYTSTKLFLHFAAAMPLQWILILRFGLNFNCSLCKASRFVSTLAIVSVFDLFRLYEVSMFWERRRRSLKVSFFLKFLRITVMGLFTMFQFIELADVLTLRVMIEQGRIDEHSYVARQLQARYGLNQSVEPFVFYIYDFARISKAILLFSFAFKDKYFYIDRIISLLSYMIAHVFYLWTVMTCYSLVYQLKWPEDRLMLMKKSTRNMNQCRQLSDKVSAKLKLYYEFNFAKLKPSAKRNHMFRTLPEVLKKEQFLATYGRFLLRIPYFSEWPISVKMPIVQMLKEEIFLKLDVVAEPWVPNEGLYIVASGELAVYALNKDSEGNLAALEHETGHLIDGDYFGELSLVTDGEIRTSRVIALTPCMMLILRKTLFRRYMRLYPHLFDTMKRQLRDKFGSFTPPDSWQGPDLHDQN